MNCFSIMDLFTFFAIGLAIGALIMLATTKTEYKMYKDDIIRYHNGEAYLEDAESGKSIDRLNPDM
jgi:hypothetical protein